MTVKPIGDDKPDLVRRGRYLWPESEVTYPRVSKLLDVMNKEALLPWAVKQTAERAYYERDQWADWPEDQALKYIKDARWGASGKAADAGTAIHGLVPNIVGIKDVPAAVTAYEEAVLDGDVEVDDELMGKLFCATAWLKENCKEMIAQELTVFTDETEMTSGWAGTADMVLKTKKHGVCIADWKTSKSVYMETSLQMAAYALSDWTAVYNPDEGTYSKGKIPKIDNFIVVHLTEEEAHSYVIPWTGSEQADKYRERLTKCICGCAHILSFRERDQWFVKHLSVKP